MSTTPYISVLINNYNYGRYLSEAIESVLAQTYQNYELIIVDDGSTDNSREVIHYYYKKYPEVIIPVYKENGGQGSAFNAGFKSSKGNIICFLDSDDFWFNSKLEKIVSLHEKFEIVQHNLEYRDTSYKIFSNSHDRQYLLKKYGSYYSHAPTSALSFSRSVLDKVFPIPEQGLRICADLYVLCNALFYTQICSINECLGHYRIHNFNGFQNNKINQDKKNQLIQEIIELLNEKLIIEGNLPIPRTNKDTIQKVIIQSVQIEEGLSYLLYGAGTMGEVFYEHVNKNGGLVKFFSDSDKKKWGGTLNRIQIIEPIEIEKHLSEIDKIIISSLHVRDIFHYLEYLGIKDKVDVLFPIIH